MFWSISLLVVLLGGTLTLWPLLRSQSKWKLPATVAVLALPFVVYYMYQDVGTPAAMNTDTAGSEEPLEGNMADLVDQLRQRLTETPDDVEGWLLLGRSYKSLQNYPMALEALETAQGLAPGQPLVMVELVEARLFASGNSQITGEMTALLEQAVQADPTLQKGLWLLGIAAAQAGDDASAIGWWQRLLALLEPNGTVAGTVTEQIKLAQMRLGEPPEAKLAASWPGLEIEVAPGAAAGESIPQIPHGSVLFIIAREAGSAGGPPLGVRRIEQPVFPVHLTLTDSDSMMPQRLISKSTGIVLQARLSLTGQALPAAGDWQSALAPVATDSKVPTELILEEKVE